MTSWAPGLLVLVVGVVVISLAFGCYMTVHVLEKVQVSVLVVRGGL